MHEDRARHEVHATTGQASWAFRRRGRDPGRRTASAVLALGLDRDGRQPEAIHSYEGTRQVNSLIVGRAVPGFGAFV